MNFHGLVLDRYSFRATCVGDCVGSIIVPGKQLFKKEFVFFFQVLFIRMYQLALAVSSPSKCACVL